MGAVAIILFLDWIKGAFRRFHSLEEQERLGLSDN